jgi:hypothetical protein
MSKPETTDQPAEGWQFVSGVGLLAIKHFAAVNKALYDLTGLFITGPFKKEAGRAEVRAALSALAQIAKDTTPPGQPLDIQPVPIPTTLVTPRPQRPPDRRAALLLPLPIGSGRKPNREAPSQHRTPRKPQP